MPEVRTVPGHVMLGDLLDKAYLPGGLPCRVPPDEHRDVSTNPESLPTSKSLEWWFSGCGPGTHGGTGDLFGGLRGHTVFYNHTETLSAFSTHPLTIDCRVELSRGRMTCDIPADSNQKHI